MAQGKLHYVDSRSSSITLCRRRRLESNVKMGFPVTDDMYQIVYDILSFSLACMLSCTVFLWMRVPAVTERYKTALIILGLVTFIAAYHYIRIFNSWVGAYHYPAGH